MNQHNDEGGSPQDLPRTIGTVVVGSQCLLFDPLILVNSKGGSCGDVQGIQSSWMAAEAARMRFGDLMGCKRLGGLATLPQTQDSTDLAEAAIPRRSF